MNFPLTCKVFSFPLGLRVLLEVERSRFTQFALETFIGGLETKMLNGRLFFSHAIMIAVSLSVTASAQQTVAVHAPYAQALVLRTKSAHPEIHKIGIHATPPDSTDNVIIAADIPSKIGKKSSPRDMELLASGKPSSTKVDKDQIYDLLLSLSDRDGKAVGFLVMEIPFTSAKDANDALQKGIVIRDEMQMQIKSKEALFQ